jgi:short-subunit dehydrogenase
MLALVDLTHRFLPLMRQRGAGDIINVASIAAFQPIPYLSVYAASKAFVVSFSEALWAENSQYGIRVLVTCPGSTATNFFTQANFPPSFAETKNQILTSEDVVQKSLKALEKGEMRVIVSDSGSQFRSIVARLVPRKTLLKLIAKYFQA